MTPFLIYKKSDINPMPEYFDRYINLVEDVALHQAFQNSLHQIANLDIDRLFRLKTKRYLPGKWTVNDIIQHVSDTERLLSAGVLRFARNESTHVISFNEDEMAINAGAENKDVTTLISELITIRKATISLYESFSPADYFKVGTNWRHQITVLAMGFNIIGHQIHHFNVIKDRYYPLL